MAKSKIAYVCSECGASSSKWQGQCGDCGAWNTLTEFVETPATAAVVVSFMPGEGPGIMAPRDLSAPLAGLADCAGHLALGQHRQ